MAKLPSTNQTEVMIFRLSPKLKEKLILLSRRSKFDGSASSVIRALIEAESRK